MVAAEFGTEFGIRTGGGETVGIGLKLKDAGLAITLIPWLSRAKRPGCSQHAAAAAHRGAELLLAIRTGAQAGVGLHRGAGLAGEDLITPPTASGHTARTRVRVALRRARYADNGRFSSVPPPEVAGAAARHRSGSSVCDELATPQKQAGGRTKLPLLVICTWQLRQQVTQR